MYKKKMPPRTSIKLNNSTQGETIEMKVRRITQNKEPIKDGAPPIYTERKDGVKPDYDIRTDRWEYAVEAMDKVTKSKRASREPKPEGTKVDKDPKKQDQGGDGKTEPTQGTN